MAAQYQHNNVIQIWEYGYKCRIPYFILFLWHFLHLFIQVISLRRENGLKPLILRKNEYLRK